MSNPEDVHEYVDATVTNFDLRRLLKWLARIGGGQDQKIAVLDVCLILIMSFMLIGMVLVTQMLALHIVVHCESLPCFSVSSTLPMSLCPNVGTRHETAVGQRTRGAIS